MIKKKCEVGTEVESKVHVEAEGSLGISELFECEDRRDGIGNFVVERVIATTLTRVPVVVEGQEVKAVLNTGVGVKDGNTWEEISRERLLEWRPAASKGELVKAGHELRKECNTNIHMDICDKDITENFLSDSTVEDLLLGCGIEEKCIIENTRKGVECEAAGTNLGFSIILDEDIQSFSDNLRISDTREIAEDRAERGLVIFVESDDVVEEWKKIDRKEGNGADISIPGHLGDMYRSFERRQRTRNELDEFEETYKMEIRCADD